MAIFFHLPDFIILSARSIHCCHRPTSAGTFISRFHRTQLPRQEVNQPPTLEQTHTRLAGEKRFFFLLSPVPYPRLEFVTMDSAKIFALGLAAGLTIHVVLRSKARQAKNEMAGADTNSKAQGSIASKSSKKSKNKKKSKDVAAPTPASEPKKIEVEEKPAAVVKAEEPAQTASKKKNKNKKPSQPAPAPAPNGAQDSESYAAVAETTPAINNETIRAKADAAQTAFTSSLGDMRDADVDPLPAGYSSVARIPAAEAPAPNRSCRRRTSTTDGRASVAPSPPPPLLLLLPRPTAPAAARRLNPSHPPTPCRSPRRRAYLIRSSPPRQACQVQQQRLDHRLLFHPQTRGQRQHDGDRDEEAEVECHKTQAKKAAKEEADRLQAERLANHRRQQAAEAAKAREVSKRPMPQSVPGAGKQTSAKASVDLNGRLVWD